MDKLELTIDNLKIALAKIFNEEYSYKLIENLEFHNDESLNCWWLLYEQFFWYRIYLDNLESTFDNDENHNYEKTTASVYLMIEKEIPTPNWHPRRYAQLRCTIQNDFKFFTSVRSWITRNHRCRTRFSDDDLLLNICAIFNTWDLDMQIFFNSKPYQLIAAL